MYLFNHSKIVVNLFISANFFVEKDARHWVSHFLEKLGRVSLW